MRNIACLVEAILILALLTACTVSPSIETSDTPEILSETISSAPPTSAQAPLQTPSPSPTETPSETPTPSGPTYEKTEFPGTWIAAPFGDRGHALLFIDEISADKLELEFLFYEYTDYDENFKTIKISEINAVADKQDNKYMFTTTYVYNVGYLTELKGQISLEHGKLSIRYDEFKHDSFSDVQLLSEVGETILRYNDGNSERQLPTVFTGVRDEDSNESLHSYPLFHLEAELPFTELSSSDEVVKILGEPLEINKSENSIYGEKIYVFDFKYEDMEVRVVQLFLEDGSSKYVLSSFLSSNNDFIPSARNIKVGDSVHDVLSRFLCEQGDYNELLTPSGWNKQSTLYGWIAQAHDFGEIKYKGKRISEIKLVVGAEILTYFIDEGGFVYQISYRTWNYY